MQSLRFLFFLLISLVINTSVISSPIQSSDLQSNTGLLGNKLQVQEAPLTGEADLARRTRFAFAIGDVQDNCPIGMGWHSSGRFCTYLSQHQDTKEEVGDDYGDFDDFKVDTSSSKWFSKGSKAARRKGSKTRRLRYAEGLGNCPPGFSRHSSGIFCTQDVIEDDYYYMPEPAVSLPAPQDLAFAFDVQDNCPIGMRWHSSGRFCTYLPGTDEEGGDDYGR